MVLAYVISGLCAAIAGIVFTARLKSIDAPLAAGYELTAIAIAVIGGTALSGGVGSPWRTLLGSVAFAAGLNLLAMGCRHLVPEPGDRHRSHRIGRLVEDEPQENASISA